MADATATVRSGSAVQEQVFVASQWRLMWWRFRRHRLAVVSGAVLLAFYVVTLFAPFFAIHDPTLSEAERTLMPPQKIHWLDGGTLQPHVFAVEGARDPRTFKRVYTEDTDRKYPVRLFVRGFPYKLLWILPTDIHLLGAPDAAAPTLFLLGADVQGRDLYSRVVYGTRVSMSIGLVGVSLSLFLGILLGGISGFYGGVVDSVIQRAIEIIRSIPAIPFWMGLAAFLPRDWSVLQIYFAITIIISVLGWTGLARVVRGRFLALRDEDFVIAAQLSGASRTKTIFRYMLPSFYSHIIAEITLSIPQMIISETALSFLGLGIRPPAVSYGTLLQAAQNVQTVALTPWLMIPAIPVTIAVLAFNFLGDGVRDAADPYAQHASTRGKGKESRRRRIALAGASGPAQGTAHAQPRAGAPPILQVRDLHTHFPLDEGTVIAVDGASFDVPAGNTLGIVGESGCGKSVTARSVLRILDRPGEIVGGEILFRRGAGNGHGEILDLAALDADSEQMRAIRGGEIALVFQEPMASFSPVHTVNVQLLEAIRLHRPDAGKEEARAIAIEALRQVHVPNPEQRIDSYAFELSGGLRQRAMIAIALSCRPSLLIADEPTTALDVTTQAQILDLIRELQGEHGMAIMLITHDMGVIAEMADEVVVMYLGRVVESAPVDDIFHNPKHPYTQALHRSIPSITAPTGQELDSIAGTVPHPNERPSGCPFHPRCPSFIPDICDRAAPELLPVAPGHDASCFLHPTHQDAPVGTR